MEQGERQGRGRKNKRRKGKTVWKCHGCSVTRILLGPNGRRSGKAPQKSKKRAHAYPRHLGLSSGVNITFLGGIIQSQHLNGQSLFTAIYQLSPFILASQEQVTPNRNRYQSKLQTQSCKQHHAFWRVDLSLPKYSTNHQYRRCPCSTRIPQEMGPPQHEPKASAWLLPPNQTLPSCQHNSLAFHKVRLL